MNIFKTQIDRLNKLINNINTIGLGLVKEDEGLADADKKHTKEIAALVKQKTDLSNQLKTAVTGRAKILGEWNTLNAEKKKIEEENKKKLYNTK